MYPCLKYTIQWCIHRVISSYFNLAQYKHVLNVCTSKIKLIYPMMLKMGSNIQMIEFLCDALLSFCFKVLIKF